MKKILLLSTLVLLNTATLVSAQSRITLKGKTISGSEVADEIWIFQNAADTVIAMNYSEYRALNRKIEELSAGQHRLERIIEAKNELIDAFENYEQKADSHIRTQDAMIETADSLYTGYRDLYRDLKSIYGLNTVSLILGAGSFNHDQTRWHPVGNVGVTYKQYQGIFEFGIGESYKGFLVQYSIPLF